MSRNARTRSFLLVAPLVALMATQTAAGHRQPGLR